MTRSMCIGTLAMTKLSLNDVLQVMFVYMISLYDLHKKPINQNVGKQKKFEI